MLGSIGVGGLPPAIPELSERHPARVFDRLVDSHAPRAMTLSLICKSSSNKEHAADRLLVLFGKGIANQLEAEGLRDIYHVYHQQYCRMQEIFKEACKHYYRDLVANRLFGLIENSPLKQLRNNDGYPIRQTVLLTMQEYLDVEPDPFQLAHEHALQRIVLSNERDERTYGMKICLQRVWQEYQDLYAFLSYACGMRVVHPLNLDRAVWISYEITLLKRDLLPGKRAFQILHAWSKQNHKTEEIARRLFACFSLIPLVHPAISSGPRSGSFARGDIVLSEKEAFSSYLIKDTLEVVFETLIGKKTDDSKTEAACFVFVTSYSQLNLTFHTHRKLLLCIKEIGKAYPLSAHPISNPSDYIHQAQLLQATKQKIDDFGFARDDPSYQLIHAALLLAHLSRLLRHSHFQRWDTFEALYVLQDKGRLYEAWLMPLYPWPASSKPPTHASGEIEKLNILLGEKQAFYLCHYACDCLNLRPIPHEGGQETWREEEKGDVEGLRRLIHDYSIRWPGKFNNQMIYFLQDGYYAAPETQAIFERLFELLCHIPPGEEELVDRAFSGLQIVWKSYPFWQPLIANAEGYGRLIPILQETHKLLEAMYPLHIHPSPSTPSYDFLLSLLLLCHLSRVIVLTPKAKEAWFDRLREITPAGRHTLLQTCLQPHFEWGRTGEKIDLERFLYRYPGLTNDQRTLLSVHYALDRRNLRSVAQPAAAEMEELFLDFAETARLIETLERLIRTPLPLRYVMRLLERPCVPQKIGGWLNTWETIAELLCYEDSSQSFLPRHLIQKHWKCVTDIAHVNGSDQIFQTISDLLSGLLLPIQGWKVYQPFLYLLPQREQSQVEPFRAQRQWASVNSCRLMVIHPLRSLSAKIDGNILTLRVVDNNLNTRTVKVSVPPFSQTLLLELSDAICNEYPSDPSRADAWEHYHQRFNTDQLLQRMIVEYPHLEAKIAPYTRSEEGKRQLNAVIGSLLDLKKGMRQALWQLFKKPAPVATQQLALKEKRRLARQGTIYRCKAGFSLLPLRDENANLNPKFSIPFEGKEPKIRRLYDKLFSKITRSSVTNALSFEVAPDEGDASDESGTSPESCSSVGLASWTGIGVDVHIAWLKSYCLSEMANPRAVEGSFEYYEITLHVSNDKTTSVTDKLPIQFHDKSFEPMAYEEFQERICWLLAILQGEWYRNG